MLRKCFVRWVENLSIAYLLNGNGSANTFFNVYSAFYFSCMGKYVIPVFRSLAAFHILTRSTGSKDDEEANCK